MSPLTAALSPVSIASLAQAGQNRSLSRARCGILPALRQRASCHHDARPSFVGPTRSPPPDRPANPVECPSAFQSPTHDITHHITHPCNLTTGGGVFPSRCVHWVGTHRLLTRASRKGPPQHDHPHPRRPRRPAFQHRRSPSPTNGRTPERNGSLPRSRRSRVEGSALAHVAARDNIISGRAINSEPRN